MMVTEKIIRKIVNKEETDGFYDLLQTTLIELRKVTEKRYEVWHVRDNIKEVENRNIEEIIFTIQNLKTKS